MKDRRGKLVQEILAHCDVITANKLTVLSVLAFHTDKALTKFHKEFLNKN